MRLRSWSQYKCISEQFVAIIQHQELKTRLKEDVASYAVLTGCFLIMWLGHVHCIYTHIYIYRLHWHFCPGLWNIPRTRRTHLWSQSAQCWGRCEQCVCAWQERPGAAGGDESQPSWAAAEAPTKRSSLWLKYDSNPAKAKRSECEMWSECEKRMNQRLHLSICREIETFYDSL